jgi:pyruvate/2-oxoglutarate dehydrogenase complex dihydrolipoamide acyltransferase (E2) component
MSKVEFVYSRGGRKTMMARRYAETLRKLGLGTYADAAVEAGYKTRMLTAAPPSAPEEPLISEAIAAFATENNVDLSKVIGTGKDGRIKKSDVEAFIAVQV